MTANRCTLEQLTKMPVEEAITLPIEQLAMLLEDAEALKADVKKYEGALHEVLTRRFAERAAQARKAAGKDAGMVTLDEGEFAIKADLPTKVAWDQAKLREAERFIREEWKDNPAEYLKVELSVLEARFKGMHSKERTLFEPARTVSAGKQTFKIIKKEAA